MKHTRVAMVVLMTALALGAVAASSAWATNPPGPLWGLGAGQKLLETGESLAVEGTNLLPEGEGGSLGPAEFVVYNAYLECEDDTATGKVDGGTPGTAEATISYSGCKTGKLLSGADKDPVESCNVHTAGAASGEIVAPVKTELVYIGTKSEAEKGEPPVGDLISPASGSTLFTIEFTPESGGSCPLTGSWSITGSSISDITEAASLWSELDFPSSRIKEYYLTKNSAAHTASLRTASGTVTVSQIERTGMMLASGEQLGVILGLPYAVTPSESTVVFGEVAGEVTRTVTYENQGPGRWRTDGYTLKKKEGPTSVFTVADECDGTYAPKATPCSVKVTFKPTEKIKYKAGLTVEGAPEIVLEGSGK